MPDEGHDPQPMTDPRVDPTQQPTVAGPTVAGPPVAGPPVAGPEVAGPEVAGRMTPQLRLTQAGNAVAVLAVVFSVASLVTFPEAVVTSTGPGWAVAALVASVVMLAICTFQHLAWLRALATWRGQRHDNLRLLTRVSFVLHVVSYAVVLFGLWACISGSVAVGTTANAAALLAFALLFLVVAQVLAGVQYLRTGGPSGTVPAYLRRLSDAVQSRR